MSFYYFIGKRDQSSEHWCLRCGTGQPQSAHDRETAASKKVSSATAREHHQKRRTTAELHSTLSPVQARVAERVGAGEPKHI